jgi:hypothetical protein
MQVHAPTLTSDIACNKVLIGIANHAVGEVAPFQGAKNEKARGANARNTSSDKERKIEGELHSWEGSNGRSLPFSGP